MALINKIREKTAVAVGIIAFGLILFVVGGDLLAPNSVLMGNSKQIVGEIGGVEITLQEYQLKIDEMKAQYAIQAQKPPTEAEMDGIREQAWNQFIYEIAYRNEFQRLGIIVTKDERDDMVIGEFIHPSIRQAFTNPETNEFNVSSIRQFIENIDRVEPQQRESWNAFIKSVGPDRERTKYMNLIKATSYVTNEEAKRNYIGQNARASIRYVYVPNYTVMDSLVNVTDADLKEYLNKNKNNYKGEYKASLKYVSFNITPTAQDTLNARQDLEELREAFLDSENDTSFLKLNSDVFQEPRRINPGELPSEIADLATQLTDVPTLFGPFQSGTSFKMYKISKSDADSNEFAKASHILIKWDSDSDSDKKKALDEANRILKLIRGGESFEDMAAQYGTDGTASRGGDLGWFGRGAMVSEFETAVFGATSRGLLPKPVETQFGYHLIKITEPKTSAGFNFSVLERVIAPSDDTRDDVFRKADYFASESKSPETLEANARKENIQVLEAKKLRKTDKFINNLMNGRELVRWAFGDAKIGAVSEVKEIDNQFIIAVLTDRKMDDKPTVDAFRDEITLKVRSEKKNAYIIEKIKSISAISLDDVSKGYGSEAGLYSNEITLGSNSLPNAGFEPKAIGKAFAMSPGDKTEPISGENGVIIMELVSLTPAGEISDYSQNKNQMLQTLTSRGEYSVNEAIKKLYDIKDYRYKFF